MADAHEEELSVAADDVFDAVTKGDRKAFASALHSYVQLCDAGGSDDYGKGNKDGIDILLAGPSKKR